MSTFSRRHFFSAAASIAAVAVTPRDGVCTGPRRRPGSRARCNRPVRGAAAELCHSMRFEPHIDAKTMEIHHDKHHGAYVANLNTIAKNNPQLGTAAVTDVLGNLNALNDDIKFAVRNNLGGHANHTMFWEIMGPERRQAGRRRAGRDRPRSRRHGKIPERF